MAYARDMRASTRPVASRPATLAWPWLDRGGRFSPLKAATLAVALLPALAMAAQLALHDLGPEPLVALTHGTGEWAIRLLLLSLLVTPLRHLADWQRVTQLRRMLGLAALGYALAHLALYVVVENFRLLHVAAEILRRAYLTIGFAALVGLAVLGATSTDAALRRLGARWKTLHRLVLPLAALAMLHFFLQSKVDVTEATLTAGLLLWLLGWRLLPAGRVRSSPLALLGLAGAAALATAALEYAWYALATGVPPGRVLAANLDLAFGPRPAVWVGIVGAAVALLPVAVRLARRLRAGHAGPPPARAANGEARRARRRAAAGSSGRSDLPRAT